MKNTIKYFGLYCSFVEKNIIRVLSYKMDTFLSIVSWIIIQLCGIVSTWIIIKQIGSIDNWNIYEIGILYGLVSSSRAFSMIFFDSFWQIGSFIRLGTLDIFLTSPIPPLLNVIAYRFEVSGIGNLLFSLGLFFYCFFHLHFSIFLVLKVICIVIISSLILSAIFLIVNCINFWLISGSEVAEIVITLLDFIKYPISIFPNVIKIVLTYFIPLSFISYFPLGYVLNKNVGIIGIMTPIVCILLWLIAIKVWNYGLKVYGSTGS